MSYELKALSQSSANLASIHKSFMGAGEFPIQKWAIFRKVKEIKELRGGVHVVHRTSDAVDWRRDYGKGPFLYGN